MFAMQFVYIFVHSIFCGRIVTTSLVGSVVLTTTSQVLYFLITISAFCSVQRWIIMFNYIIMEPDGASISLHKSIALILLHLVTTYTIEIHYERYGGARQFWTSSRYILGVEYLYSNNPALSKWFCLFFKYLFNFMGVTKGREMM